MAVNQQQIEKAVKVTNSFKTKYKIYGLTSFNSVYHYGHLFEDAFNDKLTSLSEGITIYLIFNICLCYIFCIFATQSN